MRIRILDPKGKQIFKTPEMPFKLRGKFAKSEMVVELNNMRFERPGIYLIQVLLNSEVKTEYPLSVMQIKSPKEV